MGRLLAGVGLILVVAGLRVFGLSLGLSRSGLSRSGLPLGRLPGDLRSRGERVQVFAPLGTSLLLSILLSLLLYVVTRLGR